MWGRIFTSYIRKLVDIEEKCMCNKCDCKCQPVQAYRSLDGNLYESKPECQKHDEIYRRKKAQDAASLVFEEYRPGSGRTEYYSLDYAPLMSQQLSESWKKIRDALNRIEE